MPLPPRPMYATEEKSEVYAMQVGAAKVGEGGVEGMFCRRRRRRSLRQDFCAAKTRQRRRVYRAWIPLLIALRSGDAVYCINR